MEAGDGHAQRQARRQRDHAHTLSDFRVPTLSIECEPCGRRGRYNVARLIEKYGDMKLPELRHVLANCPKANRSASATSARPGTALTAGSHDREMGRAIMSGTNRR